MFETAAKLSTLETEHNLVVPIYDPGWKDKIFIGRLNRFVALNLYFTILASILILLPFIRSVEGFYELSFNFQWLFVCLFFRSDNRISFTFVIRFVLKLRPINGTYHAMPDTYLARWPDRYLADSVIVILRK